MTDQRLRVPAIPVRQWLPEWEEVPFDAKKLRRRPEPEFHVLSLDAALLRRLTGIYRRSTADVQARAADLGVQRRHEEERSREIAEFIRHGFPWSDLPASKRRSSDYEDLKKPGWLPTAVVVNVLGRNDRRLGAAVANADLVSIGRDATGAYLSLPARALDPSWEATATAPLEVIDGQHRLWAFDPRSKSGQFAVPVVAFSSLDISWQAYLFYTINIRPKKINRSLAFDLYPLLRTEDWLDRFEGHEVYRETRAQELTEMLWATPASPWHQRINMLGEPGQPGVSQAAWIRSLMASYVKQWEGRGTRVGGLFGAPLGKHRLALPWSRTQQGAFLIFVWDSIQRAIEHVQPPWLSGVARRSTSKRASGFVGIHGEYSLLGTDQGVRAVLQVTNDLCWVSASDLNLFAWTGSAEPQPKAEVEAHLKTLPEAEVGTFLDQVSQALVGYDWRSAGSPELSEAERTAKLAFRGSGGYKELRRQLLLQAMTGPTQVRNAATRTMQILHYA